MGVVLLENTGSTAEIRMIIESPVLLIVNCASMARSAAAIVKGFETLASDSNIVGGSPTKWVVSDILKS